MSQKVSPELNTSVELKQVIKDLAKLDELEYEVRRKKEAKRLGIKVTTLDSYVRKAVEGNQIKQLTEEYVDQNAMFPKVAYWPEKVNGDELLDEMAKEIRRYTVLSENQVVAVTLWIVFTWFHEQATVSPVLNISSPEKRCGKSTLLSLVSMLSFKALTASNITPAAVFRAVEEWKPTLIIDEADSFLSRSEDLRGMINSGHYKNTAYVIRCTGEDNIPTRFMTWCAKVIAGIGDLPETIADRSIIIEMKRKLVNQKVDSIRRADELVFKGLNEKLARWSNDNKGGFKGARPNEVQTINDRANDNWEHLLVIASLAGGQWPDHALRAAEYISGSEAEEPSIGEQLLGDILTVFKQSGKDRLTTKELIIALCDEEESPWATICYGKNITPFMLSQKLKPFNITSKDFRFSAVIRKGFSQSDFEDAIKRYIPEPDHNDATAATGATCNVIELGAFR